MDKFLSVDSLEWNIQIVHIWLNFSSCVYFIILIAKVVHMSLNARGGAEKLSSIGMDAELKTMENPDMAMITEAYGASAGPVSKVIATEIVLSFFM
jgi:hypothetical protein